MHPEIKTNPRLADVAGRGFVFIRSRDQKSKKVGYIGDQLARIGERIFLCNLFQRACVKKIEKVPDPHQIHFCCKLRRPYVMKLFRSKPLLLIVVIASLMFSLAGSAFAFSDVKDDPEKKAIESLEKKGLLSGSGHGKFSPKGTLTVGNAVALLVKGMELNIDHIRFIKEPKASDYFTKVKDDAWYAQSFIIASLNGLDIPKDIDPNAKVNREQFAHWLYNALETKGDYAWVEMFIMVNDQDQVTSDYMNSIQRLLIAKIATLDAKNNFRPKQPINRSEVAGMLHRAIEFVKNTKPVEPEPVDPELSVLSEVKVTSEKVGDDVLKVTVSAMAPHRGYGIEVASIDFNADQAVVNYRLILPDPAAFYAQDVSEVKAVAYVASSMKPVLGEQKPAVSIKQETENGTQVVPIGAWSPMSEAK